MWLQMLKYARQSDAASSPTRHAASVERSAGVMWVKQCLAGCQARAHDLGRLAGTAQQTVERIEKRLDVWNQQDTLGRLVTVASAMNLAACIMHHGQLSRDMHLTSAELGEF